MCRGSRGAGLGGLTSPTGFDRTRDCLILYEVCV